MNQPDHQEYPTYQIRSVPLPDGGHLRVPYKPGTADHLTDEQIIAQHQGLLDAIAAGDHNQPAPPAAAEPETDNVRSLAAARLRHHPPGTPFRPEEIAPLLIDPTNTAAAAEITAVINDGLARLAAQYNNRT